MPWDLHHPAHWLKPQVEQFAREKGELRNDPPALKHGDRRPAFEAGHLHHLSFRNPHLPARAVFARERVLRERLLPPNTEIKRFVRGFR